MPASNLLCTLAAGPRVRCTDVNAPASIDATVCVAAVAGSM
jgi:hypothetical protein